MLPWKRRRQEAVATIKEKEEVKTEAENHIKEAMGDAEIGFLSDGSQFTWKTHPRKAYTRHVEATTSRPFLYKETKK